MKQLSCSFIILVLTCTFSKGSDLSFTKKNNDSLKYQTNTHLIHLAITHKNKVYNPLPSKLEIKHHLNNSFKTDLPQQKIERSNNYKKIRLNGIGGWSRLLAATSETVPVEFHQYVDELKTGWHLGADLSFFPSKLFGFGLKYTMFNTQNEYDKPVYLKNPRTGIVRKGKLSNDIVLQYLGPSFSTRLMPKNNMIFLSDFSIGYLTYKNYGVAVDPFTQTGSTIGLSVGFGLDLMVDDNLAFGISISGTSAAFSQLEETQGSTTTTINLDKDQYEDVTRVDISLGLKWYK